MTSLHKSNLCKRFCVNVFSAIYHEGVLQPYEVGVVKI